MRYGNKTDANQTEVVDALRQVGCKVQSLADVGRGCPDLLVGHQGRLLLLEVKDGGLPPSGRKLTPPEASWHAHWAGYPVYVVLCPEDALRLVGVRT